MKAGLLLVCANVVSTQLTINLLIFTTTNLQTEALENEWSIYSTDEGLILIKNVVHATTASEQKSDEHS